MEQTFKDYAVKEPTSAIWGHLHKITVLLMGLGIVHSVHSNKGFLVIRGKKGASAIIQKLSISLVW